jgi:hypothetical protein
MAASVPLVETEMTLTRGDGEGRKKKINGVPNQGPTGSQMGGGCWSTGLNWVKLGTAR